MERYLNQLIHQPTMKKHLGLLLIGFTLGSLVFGFINFEQSQDLVQVLLSGLLGVLVTYAVYFSNPTLNVLFDWKKYTGVRLLLGILWNTLSGFLLIWLCIWMYNIFTNDRSILNTLDMEEGLKLGILLFCAAVIYNIVYFVFYSYNQYTNTQLAELKTDRKQAELQLATLKSQLSPHFLFNCINSLSVLFHDNVQKAETFIRSMANLYQYTLENCRESLISVRSEVEFVESYAFLLKTRFGEAFALHVDLKEEHLQSKIPPLTLQLLLENAVKHNTVSRSHPISVTIAGKGSSLTVTNNKNPKVQVKPSTGVGLKNIQGRYRILSKSKVSIADNEQFTVTLPLVFDV